MLFYVILIEDLASKTITATAGRIVCHAYYLSLFIIITTYHNM